MIKLRLIQCIWTILLVLVSAIGFFIGSPMPAKATDLCGQPPALEELLIGSNLQVKVIEGNVTNSFLISQEEEAPPSKKEKIKEEKKKPPPTVQVPPQQPPMETDACEELKKALDDAKAELEQLEDAVRRLDAARQKWEQDVKGLESLTSGSSVIEGRRKWVLGRSKLKQAIWELRDAIDALQKLIREECSKRAR